MGRARLTLTKRAADNRRTRPSGFTLIELLVVIAIIAVILGIVLVSIRTVQRSGAMARELSAARQLMVAYGSYSYDHRAALMPGYYFVGGQTLPVFDEAGNELSGLGILAARYPWRLAGYLGHNLRSMYLDRWVLQELEAQPNSDDYHYLASLYPSLGINATFVGGDYQDGGLASDLFQKYFGKLFVSRLSEVRNPARLIVFGSARSWQHDLPDGRTAVEGYFRINPPYLNERQWASSFNALADPAEFGHVSLRHHSNRAVVGLLDGSAHAYDEGQMQDMRNWCDKATRPDWTFSPP